MTDSLDPRVRRTQRDVTDAAAQLLAEQGWSAVTHAEVAKRAGYSKATIYGHWPTRLDLIRAGFGQLCVPQDHAPPTGDLRADLVRDLSDFAGDLTDGPLTRLVGGVLERAGTDPAVDELRQQLIDEGASGVAAVLHHHLDRSDAEAALSLLIGGVLYRVALEGKRLTKPAVSDLVDRVLASVTDHHPVRHGAPLERHEHQTASRQAR